MPLMPGSIQSISDEVRQRFAHDLERLLRARRRARASCPAFSRL